MLPGLLFMKPMCIRKSWSSHEKCIGNRWGWFHWFQLHSVSTGAREDVQVINLDALTYAGSLLNLEDIPDLDRHIFIRGDICDRSLVDDILHQYSIDTIVHFAAETHVDRSILGPGQFIQTNVIGTYTLLEAARQSWMGGPYGSLGYGEISPCIHR